MVDAKLDVPPGLLDGPLPFGRHFSAHMAMMRHADERWSDLEIKPHQPLVLHPATAAFHYAQCVFEGLKAYRHADGRLALFRIDQNAARMANSCRIMCMAELPEGAFARAVRGLVSIDRAWIPSRPGTSLYVRPTMIASDAWLGVHPSSEYLFFVIASPVAGYFTRPSGGSVPTLRILASDRHVRVAHGGVGSAKTAGNYAASLRPALEAKKLGFDQVLYLDSLERRWCEELGAANVMFVIDGRLVTPPLGDSVLPGVTRDSLMKLAPTLGYEVVERPVSIDELVDGIGSGRVTECFSCGTAAVVVAITELGWKSKVHRIGDGNEGKVARHLRETLVGIQLGRLADPFGWVSYVDEREEGRGEERPSLPAPGSA